MREFIEVKPHCEDASSECIDRNSIIRACILSWGDGFRIKMFTKYGSSFISSIAYEDEDEAFDDFMIMFPPRCFEGE